MSARDDASVVALEAVSAGYAAERVEPSTKKRTVPAAAGAEKYLTIAMVRERYHCAQQSVRTWQLERGFPQPYYLGKHRRMWKLSELLRWEQEHLTKKA